MGYASRLAQGSRLALTPSILIWRSCGVTLAPPSAWLPGIGPSTTVALLLPRLSGSSRRRVRPCSAASYYGAQYGRSTAAILLTPPGEARRHHNRDRKQRDWRAPGAPGPALATAAIGSFHRRHHRDHRPYLCRSVARRGRAAASPRRVREPHVLALTTVFGAFFGSSGWRAALLSLFLGFFSAPSGSTRSWPAALRVRRPLSCLEGSRRRHRRGGPVRGPRDPAFPRARFSHGSRKHLRVGGLAVDDAADWSAVHGGSLAARHRHRVSLSPRCPAVGSEVADRAFVRYGEGFPSTPIIRHKGDRRRGPPRGCQ